jgi:hypothetical protein
MEEFINIIIKRLNEKGMHGNLVPSFVRDVANVTISKFIDLKEANQKLGTLGWHEYELDEHTFQLIEAVIEKEYFQNRIDLKEGAAVKRFSIPLMFQQAAF